MIEKVGFIVALTRVTQSNMFFSVLWLNKPLNQNQNNTFAPLRLSSMSFCFVWVTSSAFISNVKKTDQRCFQRATDAFEQKLIVFRGLRTLETAWKGDRSSLHESQNTDVVAWGAFNCLKGKKSFSRGSETNPWLSPHNRSDPSGV